MTQSYDAIIVGGGIGGASLASALAGAGKGVLLLERTRVFEDRVRGEWLAPWGVAEAKRIGVYDDLLGAGGHLLTRHISYDEMDGVDGLETIEIPLTALHPESEGPLCLEHVVSQNTLLEKARSGGVDVRRGVDGVRVTPGANPTVRFTDDSGEVTASCRLIVGADGRSSIVRRQTGIEIAEDPVDHLLAGLLVEGADEWPEDLQSIGKVGDINYLIFPQGGGKARLYADYAFEQRGRFSGADGATHLLEAFDMACVPHSGSIARSTPIGPCGSFPSQDAWTDMPFAEGVVLIGDAAGYNDPIIGQGQSVTYRDVRIVSELLNGADTWGPELFAPYADERRERMRRLRLAARFSTRMNARFGPEAPAERRRARAKLGADPRVSALLLTGLIGPDLAAEAAFSEAFVDEVFDTDAA